MPWPKGVKRSKDPEVQEEEAPKAPEKTERHCTVEGCYEEKAPGQTYVCTKHIRSN